MLDKEAFEEQVNEYRSLISETSLYKGLEQVLDSEELLEGVTERNECITEDWDEEDKEDGYGGNNYRWGGLCCNEIVCGTTNRESIRRRVYMG